MVTTQGMLVELLDLERIEVDIFRGRSPDENLQRVFGGQVAGQALVAAGRTVPPDRPVHSLHAYFIRPGDPDLPIVYTVDRIRDGRSFTTRRVVAVQNGRAIFALSASFQVAERGPEYQEAPMPASSVRAPSAGMSHQAMGQVVAELEQRIAKLEQKGVAPLGGHPLGGLDHDRQAAVEKVHV